MRFPIVSLLKSYGVRFVAAIAIWGAIVMVGVVVLLVQSCEDGTVDPTPPTSPPPASTTPSPPTPPPTSSVQVGDEEATELPATGGMTISNQKG